MLSLLKPCLFVLILIHLLHTSYAQQNSICNPSSCGNIYNISHPFRLVGDPPNCGDRNYELSCENNSTFLNLYTQRYLVRAINYGNYTIRLTDASLTNDTCSFPRYSVFDQLSKVLAYPYSTRRYTESNNDTAEPVTFLSCPSPVNYSFYIRTDSCNTSFLLNRRYNYVKAGSLDVSDLGNLCTIDLVVLTSMPFQDYNNLTLQELHVSLLYGFEISWFGAVCGESCSTCQWDVNIGGAVCGRNSITYCAVSNLQFVECNGLMQLLLQIRWFFMDIFPAVYMALKIFIGMPIIFGLLIYKYRRRHISMFDVIEDYLRTQKNLAPIRYSYSDLKKMTRGFHEKLGQGGYGSVYKGKLRSGSDVAVKVLTSKPSANGQDFMNEVATIGRIHHVNVVKLVGFSAERSKRALVYDFMPNGSLEKYISGMSSLSWKKTYDIVVGVARGIEYLHRGCDVQILHFDIKPHNILLDENFTPKISDFGLAKSYSTDHNTVTLTAARGTIGYVAPELINRSIGNISHKADVYSFGMMLMEMLGLKRDLVENGDDSSLFFPYWIYTHLEKWKDVEVGNVSEIVTDNDDDEKTTRKMAIVALWCIQMSPGDRPSINKVLEMLEGEVESLEVPRQPCYTGIQNVVVGENETWGTDSTIDSVAVLSSNPQSVQH